MVYSILLGRMIANTKIHKVLSVRLWKALTLVLSVSLIQENPHDTPRV